MTSRTTTSEVLIPVSGGNISAQSIGHGPAVIFLHGGPGDTHHYMKRMAKPLFGAFQCIFFDQRGTGASTDFQRSADHFKLETLFDDLLAVQKYFGASSPILVGHSWGAMYALFSCLRHPEIFRKAALISMGPLDEEMAQGASEHLVSVLQHHEKEDWQRLRLERNSARDRGDNVNVVRIDKEMMKLRVKAWVYNPDLHEQFLDDYFQDPPPDRDVNKWIWENIDGWFSWEKLKKLDSRILLATGANDSVPLKQTEIIQQLAPNATVTVFDRCGHIPWLEHPEKFYSELAAFLNC